jgi:alpha-glucosidase
MARVAMLLLACLRGNIFIYQGEELGLPQARIAYHQLRDPEAIANWPLTLGRDGARTPMPWHADLSKAGRKPPWLPIDPDHLPLAVERQERDTGSQLAFTRRVLALRKRSPALLCGTMEILEASASILAFERRTREQRLLCVFNLGTQGARWEPFERSRWRIIEQSATIDGWKLPPLSGWIAEWIES